MKQDNRFRELQPLPRARAKVNDMIDTIFKEGRITKDDRTRFRKFVKELEKAAIDSVDAERLGGVW